MHKGLLISGLALALAGCATSQSEAPPVQVEDLSAGRAASTPAEYTVKSGDTLYGIAWQHDMDYRDLAEMNDIGPPYSIQPGQRLRLGGEGGPVRQGTASADAQRDGAEGAAVASGVAAAGAVASGTQGGGTSGGEDGSLDWLLPEDAASDGSASADGADAGVPGPVYEDGEDASSSEDDAASDDRAADDDESDSNGDSDSESADSEADESSSDAEAQASETAATEEPAAASRDTQSEEPRRYTPADKVAWQWPTDGGVVGNYGEGDSITAGIDIDGQKGQPVKAAGPGIVVYAGSGVRGYGNLILLKHNDEYLSAYAHNDTLRVKENDVVQAGEVIATMGDSDAQDVRLHFEVRKDGQPQDPLEYLPAR
ncbi:peptidoglycan DD-metalloendopeptidase family protein [Halomonas eurihalina]|uniref:Peptidoglycan DD-metalloendopeptidase family protein n=2 Tax=Halomonas eurihalina TaxID=42566 RepID=A0A5D9CIW6_HALER|nr:peptidoglycan DD-metalloendopeptidase family protein [Halomonas eurihalina]MDR5858833.1 peptidoglycan DD-metalloendopeptidase family protein [Halomonas eurihalina]TZG31614.1 peptidoglycan DD-metalloendopeptidase family protein [Halomonas eurihalina]